MKKVPGRAACRWPVDVWSDSIRAGETPTNYAACTCGRRTSPPTTPSLAAKSNASSRPRRTGSARSPANRPPRPTCRRFSTASATSAPPPPAPIPAAPRHPGSHLRRLAQGPARPQPRRRADHRPHPRLPASGKPQQLEFPEWDPGDGDDGYRTPPQQPDPEQGVQRRDQGRRAADRPFTHEGGAQACAQRDNQEGYGYHEIVDEVIGMFGDGNC